MEKNTTGKYLKYAIGEIILVVIGILIALQINNWNTNRIQKQKESVYLSNITRDLKEQLLTIESQMVYEKYISEVATPIIKYYKAHQNFKVDSNFTRSMGDLAGRKTFINNAATYKELISSGNIDVISDNETKDNIIKYYQELERTELVINKNNNLYTDAVFIPEILGLSEIQFGGKGAIDLVADYLKDKNLPFIDLNEPKLKEITKRQLKIPENELKIINGINFRNFISVIHYQLLVNQKKKTQDLLEKLEPKNK